MCTAQLYAFIDANQQTPFARLYRVYTSSVRLVNGKRDRSSLSYDSDEDQDGLYILNVSRMRIGSSAV